MTCLFGDQTKIDPPYSLDIGSIGLPFNLVSTGLSELKNLNSLDNGKSHLEQVFAKKDEQFLEDEEMKLSG